MVNGLVKFQIWMAYEAGFCYALSRGKSWNRKRPFNSTSLPFEEPLNPDSQFRDTPGRALGVVRPKVGSCAHT